MTEQEFVTFTGPLSNIFSTANVVKFVIQERNFVGFKKHVLLLKDYMTKDREGTQAKIMVPIPVSKNQDKKNNIEQIVLTNHTRIFLDDNLIFYPAEQEEELALMESAIASAEELAQEYEQEQQTKPKDNEVIVMDKQKRALANQQATPKQLHAGGITKKGGFYNVSGKDIPDAAKIQEEINNLVEKSGRTFNLFVVECDKNDEKAWAKVRVEDAITHQSIEDQVVHHYNTLADAFLLDLLNGYEKAIKQGKQSINPISSFDEHNKPILTTDAKKSIIIRTLKFKQFAERDAITKASSRAYLKILTREWRSAEELESERLEVELVNSNN